MFTWEISFESEVDMKYCIYIYMCNEIIYLQETLALLQFKQGQLTS